MIQFLAPILSAIGSGFTSWNDGRVKVKEAKLAVKLAKYSAQEARYMQEAKAEENWDLAALRQSESSWKDEWLVFLLSMPFIGSFIPVVQDHVVLGWSYVSKAPLWYQTAFLGIIAASFGLRWWISKKKDVFMGEAKS